MICDADLLGGQCRLRGDGAPTNAVYACVLFPLGEFVFIGVCLLGSSANAKFYPVGFSLDWKFV